MLTRATQVLVLASLLVNASAKKSKKKSSGDSEWAVIIKSFPISDSEPLPILIDADSTPSCIVCDDIQTPWMSDNSKECATWKNTEERCENKTDWWLKKRFCRFTCADLGYPYDDDVCCDIQHDEPVRDDGNRAGDGNDDNTLSCTVCDDIQTPWMSDNSVQCATWNNIEERCQNKQQWWLNNKFCRFTCADLGYPYDDDVCCGIQEDNEPTCSECSDIETPWMMANDVDCTDLWFTTERCEQKTEYWKSNKFCQSTCSKLRHPYDDDACCSDPTNEPTKSPTSKPTKAPTSKPTKAPTPSPTKSPTVSPVESDSCVPCGNDPSPQMINLGHTCDTWWGTEDQCYDKSVAWNHYKYCEKFCADIGLPYEANTVCCSDLNRADPELDWVGSVGPFSEW